MTEAYRAAFWCKVNKNGPVPKQKKLGRCWSWLGYIGPHGYSELTDPDINKTINGHRAALKVAGVKIPFGREVHHLCENRGCVNPKHLRVETPREHQLSGQSIAAKNAKKTRCVHGHEFTKQNTYIFRQQRRAVRGGITVGLIRICRMCRTISERERRKHMAEQVSR